MAERDREMVAAIAAIEDEDDSHAVWVRIAPPRRAMTITISDTAPDPHAVAEQLAWHMRTHRDHRR